VPKAAQRLESLVQLAVPAKQARKARSEQRAPKATPKLEWLAQLAVPAKQARKARSEQRAPKARLVR
jgi:hypothetical protein